MFPFFYRTHIGDPIYPREGETDEQLADRVSGPHIINISKH